MHVFDCSIVERVDEFLYLGSSTNIAHDVDTCIGEVWGAIHSLSKVWSLSLKRSTKMRVFKASIESILIMDIDQFSVNEN